MKLGYIGLGKMGKNMVLRLHEKGIEVVAWNRSIEPRMEVARVGVSTVESIEELVKRLEKPRIIWLMLTAGDTTDEYIDILEGLLSPGDLIIDGGNSFYKDTLRRRELLYKKRIRFMDIGTSGGPDGARNGACLMIGGDKEDFQKVLPIIEAVAAPKAFGYFGPLGAGHFAKMVHNGIEYGMMEAIGEGAAILKESGFELDLPEIFRVYNNHSVIVSRLVGWANEALEEDPNLDDISPVIGHTGEGEWTIQTADEEGLSVPVIRDSFLVRVNSEDESKNPKVVFRNKVISAMRGKFGHHLVKK